MNLCSENHDEVCFEGRECPCCKLLSEINELEGVVSNLKDEIKDLQNKD